MMFDCIKEFDEIIYDRVHGSSFIISKILDLSEWCMRHDVDLVPHLFKVMESHSSMGGVINVVCDILESFSVENVERIRDRINASRERVVQEAMNSLMGVKSIATISYSGAVKGLILGLRPEMVYVSVAHPRREGEMLARELIESGVNVVLFEDAAYSVVMRDVECVVVGADAVLEDYFVNKIGTKALALLSRYFSKPFFVVAESIKWIVGDRIKYFKIRQYDPGEISDVNCNIVNVYFEKVSSELVTEYFKG